MRSLPKAARNGILIIFICLILIFPLMEEHWHFSRHAALLLTIGGMAILAALVAFNVVDLPLDLPKRFVTRRIKFDELGKAVLCAVGLVVWVLIGSRIFGGGPFGIAFMWMTVLAFCVGIAIFLARALL
jgi:hypothetical protein